MQEGEEKEDPEEPQALLMERFDQLLRQDVEATINHMRDVQTGRAILNSDDLFRMLPEYAEQPWKRMILGPLLYPVARRLTDEIYARLLREPFTSEDTVVFTAGGSATGKSSILRSAGESPGVSFVVDTTFSNTERALEQVRAALESGRRVEIQYVFRDFEESVRGMIKRALDPRSGRIVPIDDMARTHFGAQRATVAVMRLYERDLRVLVALQRNEDGKLHRITGGEFAGLMHRSVDVLIEQGQALLDELRNDQKLRRDGDGEDYDARGGDVHFSRAFYEAARSQAKG